MSRVLIITTSIRAKSNSDILAEKVAEGAKEEIRSLTRLISSARLLNKYKR